MTKKAEPSRAARQGNGQLLSEKLGRIRVSVFENVREEDNSRWYSISICRWFKDKRTGEFRQGGFLEEDMDDVERAAKLVRELIRKRRDAVIDRLVAAEAARKTA